MADSKTVYGSVVAVQPTTWTARDQQTAALATASRAAPTDGSRHYVTLVMANYDSSSQSGMAELKFGATIVFRSRVGPNSPVRVVLPSPLEVPQNTAVSLELAAGGAGVVGNAAIGGFTR